MVQVTLEGVRQDPPIGDSGLWPSGREAKSSTEVVTTEFVRAMPTPAGLGPDLGRGTSMTAAEIRSALDFLEAHGFVQLNARDEKRMVVAEAEAARALDQSRVKTHRPRGFKLLAQSPKIHSPSTAGHPPGFKLQIMASFLFSPKTYSEVLEPTLCDLQVEHSEALARRCFGKARWVTLRGYFSFWSAVFALAPVSLLKRLTELWKVLP